MILFFFCVALLLAGYFIYGALMVKVFDVRRRRIRMPTAWTMYRCRAPKSG